MDTKKKVRLRATGKQNYNGRTILPGEEFDATEEEAADLCFHGLGGLGLAVRVEGQTRDKGGRYLRRDLTVEE